MHRFPILIPDSLRTSFQVVAMMLLLSLLQQNGCWCYQYKVGDLDCWGLPPPSDPLLYSSWSKNHHFSLGDSLCKRSCCCYIFHDSFLICCSTVVWCAGSSVPVPAEPGLGDPGDGAGVQQLRPGGSHNDAARRQLPLQPVGARVLLLHQRRRWPLREEPEAGHRHPLCQRHLLPAGRRLRHRADGVAVLPDRIRPRVGSGTQHSASSGRQGPRGHGIRRRRRRSASRFQSPVRHGRRVSV